MPHFSDIGTLFKTYKKILGPAHLFGLVCNIQKRIKKLNKCIRIFTVFDTTVAFFMLHGMLGLGVQNIDSFSLLMFAMSFFCFFFVYNDLFYN